jgi:hypothetical protein
MADVEGIPAFKCSLLSLKASVDRPWELLIPYV